MSYDQFVTSLGISKTDAQQILSPHNSRKKSILDEIEVPEEFLCPITQDVMRYPVLCSDGFIYEKAAIEEWLVSRRKTSPMTNLPMKNTDMEYQRVLAERIETFCCRGRSN